MAEQKDRNSLSSSSSSPESQRAAESPSRDGRHMSLSSQSSSFNSRHHNSGISHDDHTSLSPHRRSPNSIDHLSSPESEEPHPSEKERAPSPPPAPVTEREVLEESEERRVEPSSVAAADKKKEQRRGNRYKPSLSILRSVKRDGMVKKAGLGFRILGLLFCLISFAVMWANRNQGWALDSFANYIEFRYCLAVNVIGFVYSAAQGLDLSYNLATGSHILKLQHKFRRYFDFTVDQIIAYLLISASSSATIRIDDWKLNWGKDDKFPEMATASVSVSFLAFAALASSSLLSGYALCNYTKSS